MCSGTHAGFANYTVGHDFDKVLELQTVGAVQVALCEGLCIVLAIATFVTLQRNRSLFSKVMLLLPAELCSNAT